MISYIWILDVRRHDFIVRKIKGEEMYYHNSSKALELNNVENEVYKDDLFNLSSKIIAMKKILRSSSYVDNNRMIALYGPWGTGKSTLIETVANDFNRENFKNESGETFDFVFFNAWELEEDEDIALSLLEVLSNHFIDDFGGFKRKLWRHLKTEGKTLASFVKYITENVNFAGVDIGNAIKEMRADMEDDKLNKSSQSQLEIFKVMFGKLVDKNLKNRKLIVVIDDLERCEPKAILYLLSRIKLFFTYSKKMIVITCIDKKAVKHAVENAYGKILDHNEYLEKIFDITLSLTKVKTINPMCRDFVNKLSQISSCNGNTQDKMTELIEKFLVLLDYTNPRNLKKVFNKLLLVYSVENNGKRNSICTQHFILITDLFFAILQESYNDTYENLLRSDFKLDKFFTQDNAMIKLELKSRSQHTLDINPKKVSDINKENMEIKPTILQGNWYDQNEMKDSMFEISLKNFIKFFYSKEFHEEILLNGKNEHTQRPDPEIRKVRSLNHLISLFHKCDKNIGIYIKFILEENCPSGDSSINLLESLKLISIYS